jgi:hypothetical protein
MLEFKTRKLIDGTKQKIDVVRENILQEVGNSFNPA